MKYASLFGPRVRLAVLGALVVAIAISVTMLGGASPVVAQTDENTGPGGVSAAHVDEAVDVDAGWHSFSVFGGAVVPFTYPNRFTYTSQPGVWTTVKVTDAFCKGDEFEAFDGATSLGVTNPVQNEFEDCTGQGDPDAAFDDPLFSSGKFGPLPPGHHDIRVDITARWFEGAGVFIRVDSIQTDHYKCYAVQEIEGDQRDDVVMLIDQFGQETVLVKQPRNLCNPAHKWHRFGPEGSHEARILNPRDHLKLYEIEDLSDQPHPERRVIVTNQFGRKRLKVGDPVLLAVPSLKFHDDPPTHAPILSDIEIVPIHTAIFSDLVVVGTGASGNGESDGDVTSSAVVPIGVGAGWSATTAVPPAFFWSGGVPTPADDSYTYTSPTWTSVRVTDDFLKGDQFRVTDGATLLGDTSLVAVDAGSPEVGPDAAFADPTYSSGTFGPLPPGTHTINIEVLAGSFGAGRGYIRVDKVPPGPADHYKCYNVEGDPVNETVRLRDQFHVEPFVQVREPVLLCTPAEKWHKTDEGDGIDRIGIDAASDDGGNGGTGAEVSASAVVPIALGSGWSATGAVPPAFFWSGGAGATTSDSFTYTTAAWTMVRITDDFCRGDRFGIDDTGNILGQTSLVPVGPCPDDVAPLGVGPDAAFANPAYSSGAFGPLPPGTHTIGITATVSPFGGGRGYIRVDRAPHTPVRNPDDHLVCYNIPQDQFQTQVETENQFGREKLQVMFSELLCVPSWKTLPREKDILQATRAYVKLSGVPGLSASQWVQFKGPTTIDVDIDPLTGGTELSAGGLDYVETEIVAMQLTSVTPAALAGLLEISLRPVDALHPERSTGRITEEGNATPGILDLDPFGSRGCAISTFDMYFQIKTPLGLLHTHTAHRISSRICHKPPKDALYIRSSALPAADLFTETEAFAGVQIVDGRHFPHELRCLGRLPTIVGDPNANVINGTPGNDVIDGRGGDDIICGGRGDDILKGRDGDDKLLGGRGNDRMYGQNDNDQRN